MLWQRGLEHEQEYLRQLRDDRDLAVQEIPDLGRETPARKRWEDGARRTLEAMRSGAPVIYQGKPCDAPGAARALGECGRGV